MPYNILNKKQKTGILVPLLQLAHMKMLAFTGTEQPEKIDGWKISIHKSGADRGGGSHYESLSEQ